MGWVLLAVVVAVTLALWSAARQVSSKQVSDREALDQSVDETSPP
ncbi:MAG: hypothetical protein AB8G26_00100 [Ilumatobacter sp.]